MKPTAFTRQIDGIRRDTTKPQLLHALPLSSQRRANPVAIIATYATAGFIGFAVAAAVISLILPTD